jgi:hypothetical protein
MAIPVKISANPPNTYQGVYVSQQGSAPKADGPFTVGGALYLVLSNDQGGLVHLNLKPNAALPPA